MLVGFVLITVFLSVRYGYGNDYFSYLDIFQETKSYDWEQMENKSKWIEIGWLVLNRLFAPLGFQWLIVFHTVFIMSTFYFLINKHISLGWKWLAVFFVLFNSNIMIIYLSMLRQSIAICLFLLAVDAAIDKRIIKMVFFCVLAYLFHRSSLIIIPFVLFAYFQSGWITAVISALAVVFMFVLMINDSMASLLLTIAMTSFDTFGEEYENYTSSGSRGSGLGILLELLMFIPVFYDYEKYTNKERVILFLFLMNLIVFPLQYVLLLFARIRYYYVVFGFMYLPFALKKCRLNQVKYFVMGIAFFITLWNYYQFFNDKTFQRSYSVYTTIF